MTTKAFIAALIMSASVSAVCALEYADSVVAVDYVTVNGISRKRITIDRNGHKKYLVEGIGLSDDYLRYYEQNSYYTVLQSVTENGSPVFAARDFTAETTGINEHEQCITSSDTLYDLTGKLF